MGAISHRGTPGTRQYENVTAGQALRPVGGGRFGRYLGARSGRTGGQRAHLASARRYVRAAADPAAPTAAACPGSPDRWQPAPAARTRAPSRSGRAPRRPAVAADRGSSPAARPHPAARGPSVTASGAGTGAAARPAAVGPDPTRATRSAAPGLRDPAPWGRSRAARPTGSRGAASGRSARPGRQAGLAGGNGSPGRFPAATEQRVASRGSRFRPRPRGPAAAAGDRSGNRCCRYFRQDPSTRPGSVPGRIRTTFRQTRETVH